MDLVWVDSDDRSIAFVQLGDLPCVSSMHDYIIVELIPEGQCCKLWTGKRGDGAPVQAIDGSINSVTREGNGDELER